MERKDATDSVARFDYYNGNGGLRQQLVVHPQIDPRAGGGDPITIGQMVKMFLTKLEWYSTLFPRIPVPVQGTDPIGSVIQNADALKQFFWIRICRTKFLGLDPLSSKKWIRPIPKDLTILLLKWAVAIWLKLCGFHSKCFVYRRQQTALKKLQPFECYKDLDVKMREHNKKIYATQVENQKVAEYIENAKRSKSPEKAKDDRPKSREKDHKEEKSRENRRSRSRNNKKLSKSRSPHRKDSRSPSRRKRSNEDDHQLSRSKHSKRCSRSCSKSKKRDVKSSENRKSSRHKHSSHKTDRDRDHHNNHDDHHRHSKSKKKARSSSSRSKDKSSKNSKHDRKRRRSVSSDTVPNRAFTLQVQGKVLRRRVSKQRSSSKIRKEKCEKEDDSPSSTSRLKNPTAVESKSPEENLNDEATKKSDVVQHQDQPCRETLPFDEEEGELKDESLDEKNGLL
uniref:Uncharacterized protein n=1 Tax=Romanomermis culicivorax TaxID=13658 RepID=A0A915KY58_ROMCU